MSQEPSGGEIANDLESALLTAANTRGFGSDMFVWSRLVNAGQAAIAALRAQAPAPGDVVERLKPPKERHS